jgi:hypothetical protein
MSSFLRVFKLLGEEKLLYQKLEHLVLRLDFTALAKEAYDLKSNSILYVKGERNCKLPLDVYLDGFIAYESFSRLTILTTQPSDDNFVSGYDFHSNCLWPVFSEILSSELAFVFGLSNLPIFKANYSKMKIFLDRTGHDRSILSLFNLNSYANLLSLEFQDLMND